MASKPDPNGKAKAERLAAALRENLKRRRAQARGRAADAPPAPDPKTTPAGKR